MADARTEAEVYMEAALKQEHPCYCHEAYVARGLTDPTCTYCEVRGTPILLLDAVPNDVLARYAIERGCFEDE